MLKDDLLDDDDLDDYDRALASEMDARPIYPAPVLIGNDVPVEEDVKPVEMEV